MIPVVYYAHSMRIYNTEREKRELEIIQAYFYTALIFNPNRASIQFAKNPMRECLHMVKDESIRTLVFSLYHGYVESGVYAEVRSAQKQMKPVYFLDNDDSIQEFHGTFRQFTSKKIKYKIQV